MSERTFYFSAGDLSELVWTAGKWTGRSDDTLYLEEGAPRWSREFLELAGIEHRRLTDRKRSRGRKLEPLAHLLSGRPLTEWLPERPWRFPELQADAPGPTGAPFVLLCPGTDLAAESLPEAAWGRVAGWLEKWVAPVRVAGRQEDAPLAFAVWRGLETPGPVPLLEAPLAEVVSLIRKAVAVVGPLSGLTVLAACMGVPTVIGYPEELARIQGLWEPEGAAVASCGMEQLETGLQRGTVNPGWQVRPPRLESAAPHAEPRIPFRPVAGHPLVAPLGTGDSGPAWEGRAGRKPWEYRITAVIPHLDTPEPLRAVVELLRLQTERPYILVIDTGSPDDARAAVEAMRGEDLEVHYIRGHAYPHPSEPVAVAQDLAFALCRSEYLFCTHADCFLRRRDYLQWLLTLCGSEQPAVGYQMSPRDWLTDQWEGMVSHTATLLHMPEMHRLGATWSMERARRILGIDARGHSGWPDTETGLNLVLRSAGVQPYLIGEETNYERHVDENLDHVRSYPGSQIYSPEYHGQAREWMDAALREAWERVGLWRSGGA